MFLKKIGGILATCVLTVSLLVGVEAASALNQSEQDIINALSNNSISASYTTQVRNYLLRDDVNISASESSQVISYINNAVSTANGASKISDLTYSQKSALLDDLTNACAVLGLKVNLNANADTITVTDSSGNVVAAVDYSDGSLQGGVINNYNTTNNYNNISENSGNITNNYPEGAVNAQAQAVSPNQAGIVKQTGSNLIISYAIIFVLVAVLGVCSFIAFRKHPNERQ